MHAPLMPQINILANRQALTILVSEDNRARGFWFADGVAGARVVEENVVDAAAVPCVYAFGAAEGGVADEGVAAAVVV